MDLTGPLCIQEEGWTSCGGGDHKSPPSFPTVNRTRFIFPPIPTTKYGLFPFYYCMSTDHHTVHLVHHTAKGDDLVAYMARVSNPDNQNNTKTSARLIKYLIEHQHWSPFEMVNMCVEIETTRSIAAQILRHRSFSFQEFSQRYADATLLGTGVMPELRLQDTKNRQNSIEVEDCLLYTSPSPRDVEESRMPSSA